LRAKITPTDGFWRDAVLDVLRELSSIRVLVVLLQLVHVLGDVLAKDVAAMNVCLELLRLAVIARESLCPNRSIKPPGMQSSIFGAFSKPR